MSNKYSLTIHFLAISCMYFTAIEATVQESSEEFLQEKTMQGYYVEEFEQRNNLTQTRIQKRNDIEQLVRDSENVQPYSSQNIQSLEKERTFNLDKLTRDILNIRNSRESMASATGEFSYVKNTDDSTTYFKDGLVSSVLDKREVDEFGNVSRTDMTNMTYNDKRLLESYDAESTDYSGNKIKIKWRGARYTDDSLFYGNKETNANKNILEYHIEKVDHNGNVQRTDWLAQESDYAGKLLRKYEMSVSDSVYGDTTFIRSDIEYANGDPDLLKSYKEVGTMANGLRYDLLRFDTTYTSKDQISGYDEYKTVYNDDDTIREQIKTTVAFSYLDTPHQFGPDVEPDPDRLAESVIETTVTTIDGASRTEVVTITYDYDESLALVTASGVADISGNEAQWWDVDSVLRDGNFYEGTSIREYEIFNKRPMLSNVSTEINYLDSKDRVNFRTERTSTEYINDLVNNTGVVISTDEHRETIHPYRDPDSTHINTTDITTQYSYDETAHLIDVSGTGTASGWESTDWNGAYTSDIDVDYDIILGTPVQTDYIEDIEYLK